VKSRLTRGRAALREFLKGNEQSKENTGSTDVTARLETVL
jgi:hypothetical protein